MKNGLLLFGLQLLNCGAAAQVPTLATISAPTTLWAVPEAAPEAGHPFYWLAHSASAQRPAWISYHDDISADVILVQYTYNAAGQVTLMAVNDSLSGQPKWRQTSTYDANSRLVGVVDERWLAGVPAPAPPSSTLTYAYAYDARGNLVYYQYNNGSGAYIYENSYTYDAAGTITALTRYAQQPGQARQPVGRITFTLLNGRWQSSVQEAYLNGSWVIRQLTHRYNWRNWSQRQLNGSS